MCSDTANSAWQVWQNGRCLWAKQAKRKWSSVWAGDFSLSLSLSLFALFSTLKFLNALFMRFCALFVILSLCKKATQRVARRKPQQKNPKNLRYTLFMDTSLTLSMTNLDFCLRITDIFTHILKHKFKFFTQNSRHFVNSIHFINFTQNSRYFINPTHFITLSQISSPIQGFFIFLPQIFAQFLLINSTQRSSYERQGTKAPF